MGDYANRARYDNPGKTTAVNFGRKHIEFDRSVTTHRLTAEEMELLTTGEKTYEELVAGKEPIKMEIDDSELTLETLVALRHQGLTDTKIRRKYGLEEKELNEKLKLWHMHGITKLHNKKKREDDVEMEKKPVGRPKYNEVVAERDRFEKLYKDEKAKAHNVQEYMEQIRELEKELKKIKGVAAVSVHKIEQVKEENQRLLAEVKRLQLAQQEMPFTEDIQAIKAERELFRNEWLKTQKKAL
ncbi:hypothetical protein [Bacillus solitudinis]|uniref:hypothetical protein n=1 Tax=Bacillus solitudinis TaxID=2014074 RepID=UPI000C24AE62|nr:hypothetical protein [Bacillus solitudinis]